VFGWGNLKFWEILNSKNFKYFNWNSFIFKILCLDKKKNCEGERKWMQREEKIRLVCFQGEEYWCGMESRKGTGAHRRTPPHPTTVFSQQCKAWLRPSAPSNTFAVWWIRQLLPRLVSIVLRVPLRPHLIDVPRVQIVFLEEEDHRCEWRVTSSRMRFWKLSSERENESYKGNTRTF